MADAHESVVRMTQQARNLGAWKSGWQAAALAFGILGSSAAAFDGESDGAMLGACCTPDELCVEATEAGCEQLGGVFLGAGSNCGGSTGCRAQVQTFVNALGPNSWSPFFDQFDGTSGRLERAVLNNRYGVSIQVAVENASPLNGITVLFVMSADIEMSVPVLGLQDNADLEAKESSPPLAASDGQEWEGPDYFDFGEVRSDTETSHVFEDSTDLDLLTGAGEVEMAVEAQGIVGFLAPVDFDSTFENFLCEHQIVLAYLYDRCPADVDDDGTIGFSDLISVLQAWGACDDCPADVDGDGLVGISDLLQVTSSWGACAG